MGGDEHPAPLPQHSPCLGSFGHEFAAAPGTSTEESGQHVQAIQPGIRGQENVDQRCKGGEEVDVAADAAYQALRRLGKLEEIDGLAMLAEIRAEARRNREDR